MARNPVRRATEGENEAATEDDVEVAEAGGTPGVQSTDSGSQLKPSTQIMHPGDKIVRDARDPASEAAPPPKQYEVQGGPYTVMFNNFPYKVNHGKLLSEHTHDIAALRKQGVRMVEVAPQG